MRTLTLVAAFLFLTGAAAAEPALKPVQQAALDPTAIVAPPPKSVSGLPVPRWVTTKADRVNVRRGPSLDQIVLWTYVKPGTPIEVIAEYDAWRRIRDVDGATGWVTATLLDGRRNVVVRGRVNTAMLARPEADAEVVAFAQPGVVARLVGCEGEWCEVSTRGYDGFVTRDRLWGVYPGETVR